MDNFRRGQHSQAGAGNKTDLAVCSSSSSTKVNSTKLVHFFEAGNKKLYSPGLKLSMHQKCSLDNLMKNHSITNIGSAYRR
jgi:hypothetical protein